MTGWLQGQWPTWQPFGSLLELKVADEAVVQKQDGSVAVVPLKNVRPQPLAVYAALQPPPATLTPERAAPDAQSCIRAAMAAARRLFPGRLLEVMDSKTGAWLPATVVRAHWQTRLSDEARYARPCPRCDCARLSMSSASLHAQTTSSYVRPVRLQKGH